LDAASGVLIPLPRGVTPISIMSESGGDEQERASNSAMRNNSL
jgi:hypothetical protein